MKYDWSRRFDSFDYCHTCKGWGPEHTHPDAPAETAPTPA